MNNIRGLKFGTAGIPLSCRGRGTVEGVRCVSELKLDAMEMEFVRGVNISMEKALIIREASEEKNVVLTAHAPYYINLSSAEEVKRKASIMRIVKTAEVAHAAGAYSIVFHAGYYGKEDRKKVFDKIRTGIKEIIKQTEDSGIDIWIRPETTGKRSQFGTLEELVELSSEYGNVLPCIDFAHLHARTVGKMNTIEEFRGVLEYMEDSLGRYALDNIHVHVAGIRYSDKGEIKHLTLSESDFNYPDLMKVLKEYSVNGVLISESPNIEKDAVLMKNVYEKS